MCSVSGRTHGPPGSCSARGWFAFAAVAPILGSDVCPSPDYPRVVLHDGF